MASSEIFGDGTVPCLDGGSELPEVDPTVIVHWHHSVGLDRVAELETLSGVIQIPIRVQWTSEDQQIHGFDHGHAKRKSTLRSPLNATSTPPLEMCCGLR